jgi:ERCC4-related helicase
MSGTWSLSKHITLRNDRVPTSDSERQLASAAEICRRLNDQPGLVLADDVGMGKTFVALAVAASVVQAGRDRQVVIMVPSAVADKWPKDWSVFREKCLTGGPEVRATEKAVTRGSDFLKLLDDPPSTRKHIIFVTHWAMSADLQDPFIKLAVIRHAFRYQRRLSAQRAVFSRWASKLLNRRDFTADRVEALMNAQPNDWKAVWERVAATVLDDDPVPDSALEAIQSIDLGPVRDALANLPLRSSGAIDARIAAVKEPLSDALRGAWREALRHIRTRLPLLILDEAHHLKNPNTLRGLFDADDGSTADSLKGALGGVFDRMLLLTATPFQLGHRELISVLRLFGSARMSKAQAAGFDETMTGLLATLDAAQAATQRLDRAWARLTPEHLHGLPEHWWHLPAEDLPEHPRTVASSILESIERLETASGELRPWVIRHSKDRFRVYLPGARTSPAANSDGGLAIAAHSVLPFLLAARAQSFVALRGLQANSKARALFADGLASSFEAYLATRTTSPEIVTDDITDPVLAAQSADLDWYLDRISAALPRHDAVGRSAHPKVAATIERSLVHWREGEKVLIFCFYRATGRALREHLSTAVANEVAQMARSRFAIDLPNTSEVFEELGARADSLLRSDRPGGRMLHDKARAIARAAGLTGDDEEALGDVTLRFMRTPAFLVRYVDLNHRDGADAIAYSFEIADGSGLTLGEKLRAFAQRITGLTSDERIALWDALRTFRTGSRQVDSLDLEDEAEITAEGVMLLPNVHLANGETDQALRRRLMATFNTPFLPDILVASSVMSEGVDLHRECRHIIHHDLDWNPSTLEQRTGRIDRLGSKSTLTRSPIVVCEPYVAGTQDEKQYKVVKDRERWFGVLMGGRVPEDEWSTDRIAERVPLPEPLLAQLALDLSVWPNKSPLTDPLDVSANVGKQPESKKDGQASYASRG